MTKVTCHKIKNGKTTKIPANVCNTQKKIDAYLDKGYTIGMTIETKTKHGDKTIVKTFSPLTRNEAWELHKKKWGQGVPF